MWKDYFSFNKRQRNGILVLLFLIVIMLIWLAISDHISPPVGNVDKGLIQQQVNATHKDSIADTNHTVTSSNVHIISINKASVKELSKQPGINHYLAEAIVNYREQHGPYKTLKDLLNNAAVDSVTFNKIIPYLRAN